MSVTERDSVRNQPWLSAKPRVVDMNLLRTWRAAVEDDLDEAKDEPGDSSLASSLAPGISVVVPTFRGRHHVGRCLASLAAQTLDATRYELIVVLNGPPDGTRDLLTEFRRDHPELNLRILELAAAGASVARNAGIAAVRRQYTTFVDDDDYVSESFLEVLLAHVGPRVVAMASMADVRSDRVDLDNPINRAVAQHSGTLTAPADLCLATTSNAGKAVRTELIKEIPYATDLSSGEDVLFWTTVAVRRDVTFLPCPVAEGAVYYRVMRDNSVSRRPLTFDFAVRQRLDVIARLESLLPGCQGGNEILVRDRMRAQAGFMNSYLERNPDEHGRVVELLDRLPVFEFPYDRLNACHTGGLVIAYAFPPYVDTSAIVMAKRVRARGAVVDVVSNAMDRIRPTDASLLRISGPFVSREIALRTPSYFSDWGSMVAFVTAGLEAIRRWEEDQPGYEWVYSRAQFAASHFLAAAYKLAHPDVRWIAEFSDPLSRDIHNAERGTPVDGGELIQRLGSGMVAAGFAAPTSDNCFLWCEEVAYALADEVVFTNDSQLEYMLSYCSQPALAAAARRKAVVQPQPTLGREFYTMANCDYPLDPAFLHIAYFGNFYATRGLDEVLVALASSSAEIRERVRLHVFTNKPEPLEQRSTELGLGDKVLAKPYVGFLEFLKLATVFDCLIVNDAITAGSHPRNPFLPSKWSDYRGSGTPVWGIVEAGSPLSKEPLDFATPVGEVGAAVATLSVIVRRKFG